MVPIKLKKLTRGRKGFELEISTLSEPLIVGQRTVIQYKLVEGIILTPAQLEQLQDESVYYLCDREGARLLALRPHSVGEFRSKLIRKKFPGEIITRVVREYIKKGILDDGRYALRLAEDLMERRPCGKSYLIAHLRRKFIDRDLAEITVESVLSGKDNVTLATTALESRWSSLSQFKLEVARTRAYNYLARRGFNYEAARKAFEQLQNRLKEDTDD